MVDLKNWLSPKPQETLEESVSRLKKEAELAASEAERTSNLAKLQKEADGYRQQILKSKSLAQRHLREVHTSSVASNRRLIGVGVVAVAFFVLLIALAQKC